MCISNYFGNYKEEIDALERYKQKIIAYKNGFNPSSDVLFVMSESIKYIDKIIQDRKTIEEHGREIINRVPDPEARQLLTLYYCERKTWQQIADIIYLSEQTIYRRRAKALELFEIAEAEAV